MLRLIFVCSLFITTFAFSQAIECSDDKPEGYRFLVVTNTKVLDSKKAVYIQKMDVQGEYPQLLGLWSADKDATSVTLAFAETGQVDWSKIPKKNCYTKRGDYVILQKLARNTKDTKGDYMGEFLIAPRIEIRPGQEGSCPIPKPFVAPPRPVFCDEVNLP